VSVSASVECICDRESESLCERASTCVCVHPCMYVYAFMHVCMCACVCVRKSVIALQLLSRMCGCVRAYERVCICV